MDKLFLLQVAFVVLVVGNGCNKGGSSTAGADSSSEDPSTGGGGDSAEAMAGSGGNGGASNQTGGGTGGNGGSGGAVVTGGNGGSASSGGIGGGNGGQGGVFVPSAAKQTKRDRGSTKAPFGFYEYLPPGYNDGAARPLLVYFHGIAENGNGTSDLQNVLLMGPPSLIAAGKWPANRPWVVLSAQWGGKDTCPTADFIQSVIDHGKSNYNIDPKRINLTGLSCGAIGGWDYLGKYLNADVSAAVLIAGKGKAAFDSKGCQLAKTAIWAFHGDMDGVILPEESVEIMPKLMACPQPRMDQVFTLYPGVDHDSWTKTYDLSAGHDIYKWMLANPKP